MTSRTETQILRLDLDLDNSGSKKGKNLIWYNNTRAAYIHTVYQHVLHILYREHNQVPGLDKAARIVEKARGGVYIYGSWWSP